MLDGFIDFEFGVGFKVFPDCGFGVVAGPPGAIGEHVCWHILDDGVEYDTVAAIAGERGICLQLGKHVIMGMVAVEADQNAIVLVVCNGLDLFDGLWRNA